MEQSTTEKIKETLYQDDDVKQTAAPKEPAQTQIFDARPADAGQQLIQTATSFFSQLTNVLNDVKATEALVQSLTKKDEATGQTYLQIPVENEMVIKNTVALLAGLFKGIAK
jgi:hypothetical protein